jgi:hypothetical protein
MAYQFKPGDLVRPEGFDGLDIVVCQHGKWLWLASDDDHEDGDDAQPFLVRVRDVALVGRLK